MTQAQIDSFTIEDLQKEIRFAENWFLQEKAFFVFLFLLILLLLYLAVIYMSLVALVFAGYSVVYALLVRRIGNGFTFLNTSDSRTNSKRTSI